MRAGLCAGSLSWAGGCVGAKLLVLFSCRCVWLAGECGLGHCCAWCSLDIKHAREGGMEVF